MLGDVNKLFVFKCVLTAPSKVLLLHLKKCLNFHGGGIEFRLPFKVFSTLKGQVCLNGTNYRYFHSVLKIINSHKQSHRHSLENRLFLSNCQCHVSQKFCKTKNFTFSRLFRGCIVFVVVVLRFFRLRSASLLR